MKKQGQILTLSILLLFTFVFACKKDENEQIIDVLTSKNWKLGTKDLNASTNPSGNNVYFAVDEFDQDDTFTFKTDGTMVRAYGAKKRAGNTDINKTFSYSFNKQTKELIIDGVKYTVVEENKTQFKYYIVTPGTTGVNNTIYLLQ